MPDSNRKTEALVGLFLVIGLLILGALIVQFGRFDDRFTGRYNLTVIFDDAAGLIEGSEVRMGGARIGKVAQTPVLTDEVKVEVRLSIDDRIRIPEDSAFQIASATLLGDKLIVITPPEEPIDGFIAPESVLRGSGPSGLDAIQDNAVAATRDVRQLLSDADHAVQSVDAAIGDIRSATVELSKTLKLVNDSLLSESNIAHFGNTLSNLEHASAQLDPAVGDARSAIAAIERAADGAGRTFARADERLAQLGPAFEEIPGAVESLADAADRAAATLDRIEQGRGLLGTLAYDEEISEDARTFIRNLKEQGILRYRDKETPQEDPRERFRGRRR